MERMQGQSLCNSCWIYLGWQIPGTCGFVSQMYMGKYKPGSEVKRIYTMQAQECLEAQQLESEREMWAKRKKKIESSSNLHYPMVCESKIWEVLLIYVCHYTLLGLARLVVSQG